MKNSLENCQKCGYEVNADYNAVVGVHLTGSKVAMRLCDGEKQWATIRPEAPPQAPFIVHRLWKQNVIGGLETPWHCTFLSPRLDNALGPMTVGQCARATMGQWTAGPEPTM